MPGGRALWGAGVPGVGVVGFLVVPGVVVRRGRDFSPAGSTRNPLRRNPHTLGKRKRCGVLRGCSRRLGVCAPTLDAGLSRPCRRTPSPPAPGCQRNGGRTLPKPPVAGHCDQRLRRVHGRSLLRRHKHGPGTPGAALRPGQTGVCAVPSYSTPKKRAGGVIHRAISGNIRRELWRGFLGDSRSRGKGFLPLGIVPLSGVFLLEWKHDEPHRSTRNRNGPRRGRCCAGRCGTGRHLFLCG